jgi:acetyltransferase-like isoleucine patch superfamily enzyme
MLPNEFNTLLDQAIASGRFDERIAHIILTRHVIFGEQLRLHLSSSCVVNNALFNVSSGEIFVGEHVFFGHNVCLLTGTHDIEKRRLARMRGIPDAGNDITIHDGVWVATNATILGPCTIGEDAVVAAGSVVIGNVAPRTVVAGIPSRVIRRLG